MWPINRHGILPRINFFGCLNNKHVEWFSFRVFYVERILFGFPLIFACFEFQAYLKSLFSQARRSRSMNSRCHFTQSVPFRYQTLTVFQFVSKMSNMKPLRFNRMRFMQWFWFELVDSIFGWYGNAMLKNSDVPCFTFKRNAMGEEKKRKDVWK